jgi:hypothetical protein
MKWPVGGSIALADGADGADVGDVAQLASRSVDTTKDIRIKCSFVAFISRTSRFALPS